MQAAAIRTPNQSREVSVSLFDESGGKATFASTPNKPAIAQNRCSFRRTTAGMRRRVIPSGTTGTGFFRRRVAFQRRRSIHCRRQSQWSDGGKPIALPIAVTTPFCRSSACWLSHAVVVRFVSRATLMASLEASTVPARIKALSFAAPLRCGEPQEVASIAASLVERHRGSLPFAACCGSGGSFGCAIATRCEMICVQPSGDPLPVKVEGERLREVKVLPRIADEHRRHDSGCDSASVAVVLAGRS